MTTGEERGGGGKEKEIEKRTQINRHTPLRFLFTSLYYIYVSIVHAFVLIISTWS